MAERETDFAQAISTSGERAKYDECAKKLVAYKAIIAWMLHSCTKEFAGYSVYYIMEHCLDGEPEISQKAVHQDHLDKDERLDGDHRIEELNSESNSMKEQTIYYDVRFQATAPGSGKPVQLILNLEVQLKDTPGYPLVKRGFYYCARMISEQYGTVFVDEHYEQLRKVYSIWICPDPAKKRANGIFKYTTEENEIYGRSGVKVENYDLMEVIILNLGDADKKSDVEILNLLNTLFSTTLSSDEKKKILSDDFHIAMTKELESEVDDMCNVSTGIAEAFLQKGLQQGVQQGLQKGEDMVMQLMQRLFELGRTEDAMRAANDKTYCHELMKELLKMNQ
jgi:predicted transposase/invertase (TIGR01784 family)